MTCINYNKIKNSKNKKANCAYNKNETRDKMIKTYTKSKSK